MNRFELTSTLTKRELEVTDLLCEGLVNKEVADRLNISIKTVEKHRQSVYRKLDVHHFVALFMKLQKAS